MKSRTLGRTGLKVSEISFGAWAIGGSWGTQKEEDSLAALNRALDLGVNFIDTAAGYGDGRSERIIGKVLKERNDQDRVIVTTKTPPAPGPWPPSPYCRWEDRYSEKYLRENVEERLKYLGSDRIDVLLLHTWTRAWNRNPEPLEILKNLQKEGKIRYFGISTPEHDQNALVEYAYRLRSLCRHPPYPGFPIFLVVLSLSSAGALLLLRAYIGEAISSRKVKGRRPREKRRRINKSPAKQRLCTKTMFKTLKLASSIQGKSRCGGQNATPGRPRK